MISLFAGGGGVHLGFKQAGFATVFASDVWAPAAATFALNDPSVRFHLGDIRHLTPSQVAEMTGGEEIDVVVGGPPCQGFSTLGDQIQGDPRNSFFEAFGRVIRWTSPKCVLIENTNYLRSQYSGRYEEEIRRLLESLEYVVNVKTLNAADFGTPQVRKRVFFFATRLASDFAWPEVTHFASGSAQSAYATVGEAIMDLADAEACAQVPNHTVLRHSETVRARYRLIPEGGRLPPPQELPPEIRRRNFGNTYKRLHRDRPSLTLVPGNNAFPIHPTENRSLTPREGARLQGFPDHYVFAGTRAEQCQLVGNAVPVLLARRLAEAIRSHLSNVATLATSMEVGRSAPDSSLIQLELPVERVIRTNGRSRGHTLTAVSLFTGAGGLMLGFMRAGFEVLASYDRKNIVARNSALNFPQVPHFKRDLEELALADVRSHIGHREIDVVFGGPPCQGFSIVTEHVGRPASRRGQISRECGRPEEARDRR